MLVLARQSHLSLFFSVDVTSRWLVLSKDAAVIRSVRLNHANENSAWPTIRCLKHVDVQGPNLGFECLASNQATGYDSPEHSSAIPSSRVRLELPSFSSAAATTSSFCSNADCCRFFCFLLLRRSTASVLRSENECHCRTIKSSGFMIAS